MIKTVLFRLGKESLEIGRQNHCSSAPACASNPLVPNDSPTTPPPRLVSLVHGRTKIIDQNLCCFPEWGTATGCSRGPIRACPGRAYFSYGGGGQKIQPAKFGRANIGSVNIWSFPFNLSGKFWLFFLFFFVIRIASTRPTDTK